MHVWFELWASDKVRKAETMEEQLAMNTTNRKENVRVQFLLVDKFVIRISALSCARRLGVVFQLFRHAVQETCPFRRGPQVGDVVRVGCR